LKKQPKRQAKTKPKAKKNLFLRKKKRIPSNKSRLIANLRQNARLAKVL
jgi:hypothetical protein